MTSIGRGRGWARPMERESVLRRPGQPSSPTSPELSELVDRIYDLHIDDSSPAAKVKDVHTFIGNLEENESAEYAHSVGVLSERPSSELVTKLFKLALEDRCFAIKLMKLYNKKNLPIKITFASRIRNNLLKHMQEHYES